MIVFLSNSASSISQQLRGAIATGFVGVYNSKDDRAILQAATLAGKQVLVLNTWLAWLSIAGLTISIILMRGNQLVNVAQPMFWAGVFLGLSSIGLDSISPKWIFKRGRQRL